MRIPAVSMVAMLLVFSCLVLFGSEAHAALENANVFDDILTRYRDAATAWATTITARASWLFWLLVVISMVWTFGLMAVKGAGLGDFFAEFIRFTVFTGFFWWLLINGPNFSTSIIASLKQIGAEASGLRGMGSPSNIVDIGFNIYNQALNQSMLSKPIDSITAIILSLAILIILALISVNMLLLLVSGWILAYAGIFFLGFGGSRWTSDIAINYYKTVLGVAVSLMAMVLLVGIGKTFLDDYYLSMSSGSNLRELGVMLVASLVLLTLVNKIPPMLAGIVGGGGGGIGNIGAGAAIGAAAAATGVATGMMLASASHAAGGASALKAAFDAAHDTMSSGGGMSTGLGGSPSGGSGGGGGGGGLGQAINKGVRFAGHMGSHLAKGSMAVAREGVGARTGQTAGGRVASAIRANMSQPEFTGNRFANSTETEVDREAETEAFVNSKR